MVADTEPDTDNTKFGAAGGEEGASIHGLIEGL